MGTAVNSGNMELVKLLFQFGCNPQNLPCDTVLKLVSEGDMKLFIFLNEVGYRFLNDGIISAALHGRIEILKLLIEKGCGLRNTEDYL